MKCPSVDDPRFTPGFNANLFPACDVDALPTIIAESGDRQKLQLAAACYRLNVAYQNLQEYRRDRGDSADPQIVRGLLQEVESALLRKEATEDELALFGVYATPTIRLGVIVELTFGAPGRESRSKITVSRSSSLHLIVDLELPWDSEGIVP